MTAPRQGGRPPKPAADLAERRGSGKVRLTQPLPAELVERLRRAANGIPLTTWIEMILRAHDRP